MNRTSLGLMLIVVGCVSFIGGLVFNRGLTATTVQAQRVPKPRAEMPVDQYSEASNTALEPQRSALPRWEYCAITRAIHAPTIMRGTYAITYFRGLQVVSVEESASERGALPKAIARLGEEGWELVGDGPIEFKGGTGGDALYFKRPRP